MRRGREQEEGEREKLGECGGGREKLGECGSTDIA